MFQASYQYRKHSFAYKWMYSSHKGRKPSQNTENNKQAQHPLTAASVNFTPFFLLNIRTVMSYILEDVEQKK